MCAFIHRLQIISNDNLFAMNLVDMITPLCFSEPRPDVLGRYIGRICVTFVATTPPARLALVGGCLYNKSVALILLLLLRMQS